MQVLMILPIDSFFFTNDKKVVHLLFLEDTKCQATEENPTEFIYIS